MSWWQMEDGEKITGAPEESFTRINTVVPDGTRSKAKIISCAIVEKSDSMFIQVDWQLTGTSYKGCIVQQKIRVFDADYNKKKRSKNMLMLLMKLTQLKLTHSNEPTNDDLGKMVNRFAGIVIREWSAPHHDGSMMKGNFVTEVHALEGFEEQDGVKKELAVSSGSFHQGAGKSNNDQDIPF